MDFRNSEKPASPKECLLIVTEDVRKVEKFNVSVDNALILLVSPSTPHQDIKLGKMFAVLTKQSFSFGKTLALLKRVSAKK